MTPRSHFAAPRPADDGPDAGLGEYSPSCSEKMSEFAAWAAAMIRVLMTVEVLDTVRYCRFRTTYLKEKRLLEVGVAVMSPETSRAWRTMKYLMTSPEFKGRQRRGVAPKSLIEKRIEATLRKIKAWK